MRQINNIVLHCTATPQTATVQSIMNYWKFNLKWKRPGYHFLIDPAGMVHNLLSIEDVSNGVAGHNSNSVHISYIGGVDEKGKPVDNRTRVQEIAMIEKIKELRKMFPNARILGHRDFPGVKKDCPSFDTATWLRSVGIKS